MRLGPEKHPVDSCARDHGHLFLGNCDIAKDKEKLDQLGIHAILNVTSKGEVPNYFPTQFAYSNIHINDDPSVNILDHVEKAFEFIHEWRHNKKKPVLVHCAAGVSRSPSIVISYLMRTDVGMSFAAALKFVQTKRELVSLNDGFARQLMMFSKERTKNDVL